MKRVHRDCFLGSDAVDFMVRHGLADSRAQAVRIGKRICDEKFFRPVGDNSRFKDASHLYYRFAEDDRESSMLSATNGGHGASIFSGGTYTKPVKYSEEVNEAKDTPTDDTGPVLGQGGNKWSFCPHTVHNSYIIDVGLAEEVERVCANDDIEARLLTFQKLRDRVKEVFSEDAPNWSLAQSQEVHGTEIAVYQRKRPRGDFKNLKMTCTVGTGPQDWTRGILGFDMRKQWEPQFEDGVVVEGIDLGEPDIDTVMVERSTSVSTARFESAVSSGGCGRDSIRGSQMMKSSSLDMSMNKGDDHLGSFLKTVDLAGIPEGMAIAILGGAEREETLGHLRKQMMLSSPEACMSCNRGFNGPSDIRFCPCCAMVSCTNCVRHRVFEAAERNVVNVCVHCFNESSRIKHPPKSASSSDGNARSWALETLESLQAEMNSGSPRSESEGATKAAPMLHGLESTSMSLKESVNGNTTDALYSAANPAPILSQVHQLAGVGGEDDTGAAGDSHVRSRRISKPLLEGLEEGDDKTGPYEGPVSSSPHELGDGVGREVDEGDESKFGPIPKASKAKDIAQAVVSTKGSYARCRKCGELVKRDMLIIEEHQAVCMAVTPTSGAVVNKNKIKDKGIDTGSAPKSSSPSDTGGNSLLKEDKKLLHDSSEPGTSPGQSPPGSSGLFQGIKNALGLSSRVGKEKSSNAEKDKGGCRL